MPTLSLSEIYDVSYNAMVRCGCGEQQAKIGAQSIVDAEADGIRNVGLNYLSIYLGHLLHGKLDGHAVPELTSKTGARMLINVNHGFGHTAFDAYLDEFVAFTKEMGIAAMILQNSYTAGVLGWFNNILAEKGLVSLMFANAPSSVTPWGGKGSFFGTNPIGFGAPRAGKAPIIVDLATSATAKVNIKQAAYEGREIPDGWALDKDGNPTNDPKEGLAGGLMPLGGAKGYGLGMMVEILAAGLGGGNWAHEAPSFGGNEGGYPDVSQMIIAIDPSGMGAAAMAERLEGMITDITAIEGVRLPGGRRAEFRANAEANGIEVPQALLDKIASHSK